MSWRGKKHSHVVQCRLDRAISNSDWSDLYPSARCQYLKYEGSDHRPPISFKDTKLKRGIGIFRYDRRLRDNEEVKEIVKNIWETYDYLKVEERLSLCRKAICKWSKEFHENSRKTLEETKAKLDKEMSSTGANDQLIHELNSTLLKAYKAEEDFWK